jgi:hypothetical protein
MFSLAAPSAFLDWRQATKMRGSLCLQDGGVSEFADKGAMFAFFISDSPIVLPAGIL